MRLSRKGLEALVREEGLRLAPYNDSAGHATIGVGHLIHHGPVTAADRARYRGFTRADALEVLRQDVRRFEAAVDGALRRLPLQGQFDAMVSLAFNIGPGGFASSTVVRRFNAGDRRGAADAFLMWRVPSELLPRRRRERAMFLAAADPLAGLTAAEKRWIVEYDGLRRRYDAPSILRKRELRDRMTARRKALWRAAQPPARGGDAHGWAYRNRRVRYRALKARTS